jgi:hypothetical protein
LSYPVNLDEDDFQLFRLARLLGKQKVLELLKTINSKKTGISDVLNFAQGGKEFEEKESDREVLTFLLSLISNRFPDVEIPSRFHQYLAPSESKENVIMQEKKAGKRVRRGERTLERAFMFPILESLIELGGSGSVSDVLDRVYIKMKDKLKPVDLETLPSGTSQRWKNAAQWERLRLVRAGLLDKSAPSGIWVITQEGRKYYESNVAK